jgi:hypothetical protein
MLCGVSSREIQKGWNGKRETFLENEILTIMMVS